MAQYGSNQVVIMFDDSGGTPQDMSAYVREFNGVTIEAILNETHTFGDSWFKSKATGMKKGDDVVWGGHYNDTASVGPDAVFNAPGDERTASVTWGGSNETSAEMVIVKYARLPILNDLTKFQVTLRPTDEISEA